MKRCILAFSAVFLSLPLLFSGCMKTEKSDAVLLVGEYEVSRKEFEYQLVSMMNAYEYYNGSAIDWSLPIDGMDVGDYFKEQAADSTILYRAVKVKGEEMGLALTQEELDQIDQSVFDMITQAGGEKAFDEQLAAQGLDRELYTYILAGPESYYKIFQVMYGEGGEYAPTDESVNDYFNSSYIRTQHIMRYLTDEEGSPLDEEASSELHTQMDDIYTRLQNGEDFVTLMDQYNEDVTINGGSLCFSYGEMPEDYYQASVALEADSFSEVLEIDGSLCVICRLALDESFLDDNYDSIREEYATEAFNHVLEDWKTELTVKKLPLYSDIDVQAVYSASKELTNENAG